MRTTVITLIASVLLPIAVSAQDDLYFTPSKEDVKAMKDAKQAEYDRTHGNYHIGRNVSVDEYNRRFRNKQKSQYAVVDGDSVLASDIIDFRPRPADGSDTLVVDTIYDDEEDFQNSYELSRWTDDYYCGYYPWFRPYNYWGVRYYGWYDPWYRPYWDPWYDPWFDPWWGPSWAWDPWWYDRWYWRGAYWPGYYYPSSTHVYYGGGGHRKDFIPSTRSGYGPRNDAQRNDSHFYANHSRSGSYGANRGTSYRIAQRNGGTSTSIGGSSGYAQRSSQWSHSTYRDSGNSGYSQGSSSRYSSSSSSNSNRSSSFSSHSSVSSSGSYSGSSSSSGRSGGSSSSSGGGFSGGGSHGGGGFGSHRR